MHEKGTNKKRREKAARLPLYNQVCLTLTTQQSFWLVCDNFDNKYNTIQYFI